MMVSIKNQNGNAKTEKMINEFRDILRRKKVAVRYLEAALSRYDARQELTDSVPRFDRQEAG